MTFNKNIAGNEYAAQGGTVYIYTLHSNGRFVGVAASTDLSDSKEVATLTGWTTPTIDGSIIMFQTVSGKYIDLMEGWYYTSKTTISQSSAQKIVDKLISNNNSIAQNNLLCARFPHKLTNSQKQQLYNLQKRLENRNQALQNEGILQSQTDVNAPAGYSELQQYLDTFMQNGGVGSLMVALVVAAIVVASLSTAAYFAYQYYYKESEQDVRFSNELTKTLTSKLTDAEYKQLLAETQGIVTKAKIKAKFGSTTKTVFIGAAIAAIGLILLKFKSSSNE